MRLNNVLLAAALASSVLISGCNAVVPNPGHQAVLVRKPWLFGHGGIIRTPVSTGRTYTALSTVAYDVNMQPLQYEEKFDDLMSADGIPLGFDSIMRFRITDSVMLIEKFGTAFYENNVQNEFRNRVRQAVRKHDMNEVAINTTAIDAIDLEVTEQMESYIKSSGLPIQLIKITVGKANPPDAIKNQRIRTAEEEQRRITEFKTQIAEESRKGAETARAAADNAYRESLGLSPEQFIQLERIKMERQVCGEEKSGCTFISGANVSPVIGAR